METTGRRIPQPVHGEDPFAPAPPDLERLRRFLSLHDHESGTSESFPPSQESMEWWLRTEGGLDDRPVDPQEVRWTMAVRDDLVALVGENMGEPPPPAAISRLDEAAIESGLRPAFADEPLRTHETGVRGAVGTILAAVFLARSDGRWGRFRRCADPSCPSVFYDRSKNHSAKWCSMQTCGNRNKVRAFRERQASGT